jgi:DNA-binding transcriptional regulator YiaG
MADIIRATMQLIHNKRLKPLTRNLYNRHHAEGMAERVKKLVAELKAYCQAKGIRQVQLADELKVSTQWVNDWFTGRKPPTAEKALEIQEWLKTKPEAKKRKPKTE